MMLVAEPALGDEEKSALAEVIDSGWITMGDRVAAFERAFAEYHHAADAVAVSSCTTGLHLALVALGIGPGDEVLVPSLTFVATANSVVYASARPVFVDIESLEAPHMSVQDAAAKCGPRTKAVIVMHYGVYLADDREWRRFADANGLYLIEDAAHAAGAKGAGTLADAAVFSFYGNKNMTTAEGGMVFARDAEVLKRARHARSHGMTVGTLQRLTGSAVTYDVTALGYNYRMDDLRAAVGQVQLKRLEAWSGRRAMLTDAYRRSLASFCPEVTVPFAGWARTACHILPILLPARVVRQQVAMQMREAGIQTTVHYPPVHLLSWHRRFRTARLPLTEEFARRELTLPLHQRLELSQVQAVAEAVRRALLMRKAS